MRLRVKGGVQLSQSNVKSYTQQLSTSTQRCGNTPKGTLIVDTYLTSSLRLLREKRTAAAVSSLKRSKRLWASIAILAVTSITGIQNANATGYSVDHLKLYAHSRIVKFDQFICFNKIITKESRWSYTAHNGSHWGLGQMRSTYYRNLDPYRQIDATIKYITNRYKTPCKAWQHHVKRNWF